MMEEALLDGINKRHHFRLLGYPYNRREHTGLSDVGLALILLVPAF